MLDAQVKKILIGTEVLSNEEVDRLTKESEAANKPFQQYLFDKKIINPVVLYENAANFFGLPYIDLKNQSIRKDVLFTINETIATTHNLIAFDADNKDIKIATIDPEDLEIFEFIKKKTNLEPKVHITTPENIKEALKQYHKSLKAEFDVLTGDISKLDTEGIDPDQKDLKKLAEDLPVVRIVDTLLEYAIMEGASDIHIEPEEKNVTIRYRIDGILHNVMVLPKNVQSGITARIKILSNLKVDEHRLPQDGRFKIHAKDYKVSFRVSILPTFDGEKIVMRLLNEKGQLLTLEQIGLHPRALEVVRRNLTKPYGIVLVTGPTGSGKSTTLYTVLNMLNRPEVNISTIEDPIEFRMPHVNQSQINPKIGYTFAAGLRAFLRQDPNIIMVGEIRDQETAEIAMHAAMTGHLVLSTLHTNDSVSSINRLTDMGIPAFLLATTFNIIIAQRLVRKICPNCIQSYNLDKSTIEELQKSMNMGNILSTLEKEKSILDAKKGLETLLFYRGKGCKRCNNTGYKGRVGIYEVFENNEAVSGIILKKGDEIALREQAIKDGMISMIEDGFIKAKNGVTTIEELLRVTRE